MMAQTPLSTATQHSREWGQPNAECEIDLLKVNESRKIATEFTQIKKKKRHKTELATARTQSQMPTLNLDYLLSAAH